MKPSEMDAALAALERNAGSVGKTLGAFQSSAAVLSRDHSRLMEKYDRQWVAIHGGKVKAHGPSLDSVLTQLEEKQLPRRDVLIHYIDRNARAMIL